MTSASSSPVLTLGVYRAALNGLEERGEGGVVYMRGDECGYVLPDEVSRADVAEGLRGLLADEQSKTLFYLLVERDGRVDVHAFRRDQAIAEVHKAMKGSSSSGESRAAPDASPRIEEVD